MAPYPTFYFDWKATLRPSTRNSTNKQSWLGEIMDIRLDLAQAFGAVHTDILALQTLIGAFTDLPEGQVFGPGVVGVGPALAPHDHVHPMDSGTPLTVTGPDNREGSGLAPSRFDHQHRLELSVLLNGNYVGQRPSINLLGSGIGVLDNPLRDRIDVTITGGGSGGSGAVQNFFDAADWPGAVTIGTVGAGRTVEKVVLEILTPFDVSVGLTVGEDAAMARLMAAADNRVSQVDSFMAENDYLCPADTIFKLYFTGPAPTVGAGRVIIYHS